MSEIDNLKRAVADVQQAARDEANRVIGVITTLRANPSAADVQAAADALESVAANLNAVEAAPTAVTATTSESKGA